MAENTDSSAKPVDPPAAGVVLSAAERETLAAVVQRLVPSDELGPGAVEAGIPVYVDRCLASEPRPVGRAAALRRELAALDEHAAARHGRRFSELSEREQDGLLEELETIAAAGTAPLAFETLLELTLEGFFCDPRHGGNVAFTGWDLLGYPGVRLRWSEDEQQLDRPPPPAHRTMLEALEHERSAAGSNEPAAG